MYVPEISAEDWGQLGLCPEGDHNLQIINLGEAKDDKNGRRFQRVTFKRVGASPDEDAIFLNVYIPSATQRMLLEACEIDPTAGGSFDLKGKIVLAQVYQGKDRDIDGTEVTKAKIRKFVSDR